MIPLKSGNPSNAYHNKNTGPASSCLCEFYPAGIGSGAVSRKGSQESLLLASEYKAKRWEAIAYIFLGFGHLNIGAFDLSREHFTNALVCTQHLSDQLLPVYSLLGLGQVALATQQIEKACLFLGVIDTFLHKPGTSLVPIVGIIYSSTLSHVKALQIDQLEALMDKGRKMRLSDGIQMVLEGVGPDGAVTVV